MDGVRGLAALAVAFGHLLGSQNSGWPQTILSASSLPIINLPWNGSAAVSLFFVLSGFVLTLAIKKNARFDIQWIAGFVIGRVSRIAFPFWGALLLSAVFLFTSYNPDFWIASEKNWMAKHWYNGEHVLDFWLYQALLLLPNTEHTIIPPGWTLTVELQISIVLPLIFYFLIRKPVLTVTSALVIGVFLHQTFVFHFLLGMLLALYYPTVMKILVPLSPTIKWLILLSGLFLLSFTWQPYGKFGEVLRWCINGSGAVAILAIGGSMTFITSLLSRKLLQFLGRISYSLYLIHFTIYLILIPYLTQTSLPQTAILVIAIATAILSATLFHYLVEVPSITAGRYLRQRISSGSST